MTRRRARASAADRTTRSDSGPARPERPSESRKTHGVRNILDDAHIHPAIRGVVAANQADTVHEVQAALAANAVVVVGMKGNPFVRKARKLLAQAGVAFIYLEYGSYVRDWRRRGALKMWAGWPTFPMVFVKGTLVGGASDLQALIASGDIKRMLA